MENSFYLKITNHINAVRVTPVHHPCHQLYHVVFEDGYENIFFTDVETGNWIEEDLGETALAAGFGEGLSRLKDSIPMPLKSLSWCRASIATMVVNFGFCTSLDEGNTIFELYADNHKFLCNLVKNKQGKWIMFGSQRTSMEHQYINQVQVIISVLEGMADCK
ncbi:MAG: hypothetical protein ABIQ88_07115 [Chitinophagaceae bacterium]